MNILAVIPARSGSKGILDKNIYLLAGKPLIAYSIGAALASKYVNRVLVSTDSEVYANISRQYGAEVPFFRPKELAEDNVHSVYPILHCLEWLKLYESYQTDIIIMLLPTAPLRHSWHIDEAIEVYMKRQSGTVISVTEATKPPQYIRKIIDDRLYPYEILQKGPNYQRQDLPRLYELNGSIYITSADTLQKQKTFHGEEIYPYVMEKRYSIDINDIYDMQVAEVMLRMGGEDD